MLSLIDPELLADLGIGDPECPRIRLHVTVESGQIGVILSSPDRTIEHRIEELIRFHGVQDGRYQFVITKDTIEIESGLATEAKAILLFLQPRHAVELLDALRKVLGRLPPNTSTIERLVKDGVSLKMGEAVLHASPVNFADLEFMPVCACCEGGRSLELDFGRGRGKKGPVAGLHSEVVTGGEPNVVRFTSVVRHSDPFAQTIWRLEREAVNGMFARYAASPAARELLLRLDAVRESFANFVDQE